MECFENMLDDSERRDYELALSKVKLMKEPLLKKILSGEKLTSSEIARLDMIDEVINELDEHWWRNLS